MHSRTHSNLPVLCLALLSAAASVASAQDGDPLVTRARELEIKAYESKSLGDFKLAADALDAASAKYPDDMKLHRSAGSIWLERLKDADRAYPHLEAAYKADPATPGWGHMLAQAAGQSGRKERQLAVLKEVAQANEYDPWVHLDLGQLLLDNGRADEARPYFEKAHSLAPREEWVSIGYARFLNRQSDAAKARQIAEQGVKDNPQSAAAQATLGDIYRSDWDLTLAANAYTQAKAIDPAMKEAEAGLREIRNARAPRFSSVFYQFEDTDNFYQSGLFNNLTVSLADKLYLLAGGNLRWFEDEDTGFERVDRYEQSLGLEYRANRWLTFGAAATAFQTEAADDHYGAALSFTVKPADRFYASGFLRLNDPVNDSIFAAAYAFTQDVVGLEAGYQFTDRLGINAVVSGADYSDGNRRLYSNVEASYLLLRQARVRARFQYEIIDYEFISPFYSSPEFYQILRPLIEAEPQLTRWLWVRARFEVPYVVDDARWGTGVAIGPVIRLGDRFEFFASYLRYDIPGEFTRYSGEGFKVGMTYRF
jgi:tetratricopeptide (TPR) repeat protein